MHARADSVLECPKLSRRPKYRKRQAHAERIIVVMPAYNAARTLAKTYHDLPHDIVDLVIVVDDASRDNTVEIASRLDLRLLVHDRNRGYGANQKTCYREALRAGATIIVMVHPDYQYDPRLLPCLVAPIAEGRADVVFGSRFLGVSPVKQGMPRWKFWGNRALTWLQNAAFGLRLLEYHTGYRAFRREALEAVPFWLNSDQFVFDQDVIAQMVAHGFRIAEIPVPTRYAADSSSASFVQSVRYGISVVLMLMRFKLHEWRLVKQRWLMPVTCSDVLEAHCSESVPITPYARVANGDPRTKIGGLRPGTDGL
jgi:glycosyltransferase involved in cell wall biosynthesis